MRTTVFLFVSVIAHRGSGRQSGLWAIALLLCTYGHRFGGRRGACVELHACRNDLGACMVLLQPLHGHGAYHCTLHLVLLMVLMIQFLAILARIHGRFATCRLLGWCWRYAHW